MAASPEDWIIQADYDFDTAECMFASNRHFYAAFMCHLSLEKALKGVYQKKIERIPPKTHNLVMLLKDLKLQPPYAIQQFLIELNAASVAIRYPESLPDMVKKYPQSLTRNILDQGKEALEWIKQQF